MALSAIGSSMPTLATSTRPATASGGCSRRREMNAVDLRGGRRSAGADVSLRAQNTVAPARGPGAALGPLPHRRRSGRPDTGDGFMQRWLILEPIRMNGQLTDSAVQAADQGSAFPPNQLEVPRHGDKVTVGDANPRGTLSTRVGYNVNLYHFAYARNKPTSNALFWVTTVSTRRGRSGRAAGDRLERGLRLVGQRRGGHRHLQRPAGGHRRWRVEAADVAERAGRHPRRHRQRRRSDRLLRTVSRRSRYTPSRG